MLGEGSDRISRNGNKFTEFGPSCMYLDFIKAESTMFIFSRDGLHIDNGKATPLLAGDRTRDRRFITTTPRRSDARMIELSLSQGNDSDPCFFYGHGGLVRGCVDERDTRSYI